MYDEQITDMLKKNCFRHISFLNQLLVNLIWLNGFGEGIDLQKINLLPCEQLTLEYHNGIKGIKRNTNKLILVMREKSFYRDILMSLKE